MFREDKYFYAKERSKFGRQCVFVDHNELIFDEPPNQIYTKDYILRNPVNRSTQLHKMFALSECLTTNCKMKGRGINHIEGGWPKDLNPLDEEQTTRQRKKIMRDDIWVQKMPDLLKSMEKAVLQNGAIEIYEQYFEGLQTIPPREEFGGKTVNIFKDKKNPKRPISSLTWSPDGMYIGGSYSVPNYTETADSDPTSYLWNIENNNLPCLTLTPKIPIMSLQYNPRDQFLLAGGLLSGGVAIWDQRSGGKPTIVSEREISHSDRVNSLLWTSSKSNSEFFSGSADGTIYFWDMRHMGEPIDKMYFDPVDTNEQETSRSYGVSVIEFEPTIPTRFMVGSDQGHVFTCNRKGKTATEKIIARFQTNAGRIYSLERNPSFPKNFLTIGDWNIKIWSDEWRDAPIIWMTNESIPVLSGTWSKTRCSLFFITKYDGLFEAWDLLIDQNEPIMRIKLAPNPLLCCASHENGQLTAVGGNGGMIYLVSVSDNMATSSKLERPSFSLMMDRETRREKAFDSRLREIKLKMRQEQEKEEELELQALNPDKAIDKKDALLSEAQKAEKAKIEEEKKRKEEEEKRIKAEEAQKKKEEEEKAAGSSDKPGEETSIVPHGGPPPPDTTGDAEAVVDLPAVSEKEYYAQIEKEMNKRDSYEILPVITPFDYGFDKSTIMTPEQIEEEHKAKISELKARVIRGILAKHRFEKLKGTATHDESEDEEENKIEESND